MDLRKQFLGNDFVISENLSRDPKNLHINLFPFDYSNALEKEIYLL